MLWPRPVQRLGSQTAGYAGEGGWAEDRGFEHKIRASLTEYHTLASVATISILRLMVL